MPIEQVNGRIKCGDKVIFENVAIRLDVMKATPTKRGSWRGWLTPPKITDVMSLGQCQIELADGRKGDIWFATSTVGGPVSFRGTGPLR